MVAAAPLEALFREQQEFCKSFFAAVDYDAVAEFVQKVLHCKGVVLWTGVGKSAYCARKISMTLVSTGTRAMWLAPVDALHGDIGLVGPEDIVVMLSKSGETEELRKLVPYTRTQPTRSLLHVGYCASSALASSAPQQRR